MRKIREVLRLYFAAAVEHPGRLLAAWGRRRRRWPITCAVPRGPG